MEFDDITWIQKHVATVHTSHASVCFHIISCHTSEISDG